MVHWLAIARLWAANNIQFMVWLSDHTKKQQKIYLLSSRTLKAKCKNNTKYKITSRQDEEVKNKVCNKKANTANSVRLLCGLLTQFVNLSRFKAGFGAWRKPPAGRSCCCWRRRCRLPSWKSCNSFDSFHHSNCPLTSHNLQTKYRQD